MNIVTLCTGNVARSVMLGYMLETLAEERGFAWSVRSAGTFAVEQQAMSSRTLHALERIDEVSHHSFSTHRSRQITRDDVDWADVIFAAEADHVRYVRQHFAEASHKVVSVKQFVAHAPLDGSLAERVRDVARHEPENAFDVVDPAGGDQAVYDACAMELWELTQAVDVLLATDFDY